MSTGILVAAFFLVISPAVRSQSVPAAIYTDPPAGGAHPARMEVLHIPTHGVLINGVLYAPSGEGLHPTIVICTGFLATRRISTWHRLCGALAGMR